VWRNGTFKIFFPDVFFWIIVTLLGYFIESQLLIKIYCNLGILIWFFNICALQGARLNYFLIFEELILNLLIFKILFLDITFLDYSQILKSIKNVHLKCKIKSWSLFILWNKIDFSIKLVNDFLGNAQAQPNRNFSFFSFIFIRIVNLKYNILWHFIID
jgi:hypothetical protein